ERDLRYGPDERHRLDVHTSGAQASAARANAAHANDQGAPVFLFVHGGGFTIPSRPAPGHRGPSGAQDVAAAVQWVRDNIASRGGDPDRIVVAGNSAGRGPLASYLAGHAHMGHRV